MTTIHHGDCIETMNAMPPESVDAIVTDPPYGLGFMGKKWDGLPPSLEWAEACYRALKPGGHIAAFGGTRTWHRLAVAIEDAGFEMRDSLAWLYGSGFPKSMNVSKAIASGGGRPEDIRRLQMGEDYTPSNRGRVNYDHGGGSAMNGAVGDVVLPPEAERWQGWGTALKPAFEPIVLARKPLAEKTVAGNVLAHGTGAINIDGCRIGDGSESRARNNEASQEARYTTTGGTNFAAKPGVRGGSPSGRWPANAILDQHAAAWVDEQSGVLKSGALKPYRENHENVSSFRLDREKTYTSPASEGGASRFFYTAKAPKSERPNVDGVQHPTVKPLAIMRWLIRLVTPPGGTVLDPFAGSGTTIEAALIEGFDPVGIEMEADYLPLIQHRIDRQAGTLTA